MRRRWQRCEGSPLQRPLLSTCERIVVTCESTTECKNFHSPRRHQWNETLHLLLLLTMKWKCNSQSVSCRVSIKKCTQTERKPQKEKTKKREKQKIPNIALKKKKIDYSDSVYRVTNSQTTLPILFWNQIKQKDGHKVKWRDTRQGHLKKTLERWGEKKKGRVMGFTPLLSWYAEIKKNK